MVALSKIEIDITARFFLDIFTKYAAKVIYTHYLLTAMIAVKEPKDRLALKKKISGDSFNK